jgi:xanthine dehydrogenase YagR molybdenum-binding subunit
VLIAQNSSCRRPWAGQIFFCGVQRPPREIDRQRARYVNDNLADYLVPVNADIQQLEVILVPEEDDKVNPAGVKGIGELGNVGTAAAVANAVYNATGKRVRELPIRLEKLLA